MATVKRISNGKWQTRYRDPDGKQRARNFDEKADAKRFAASVMTDVARGEYVDQRLGQAKLSEFSERWQATRQHLSRATRDLDRSLLSNPILPAFGDRSVSSIRRSEISAWLSQLEVGSSTKTKCLQKLSSILELAVGDGALKSNPEGGVTRPKVKSRQGRDLSQIEFGKIIEAAEQVDPDTAAMVWLMGGVGLQVGEVLALKRSDIEGHTLHIRGSMSRKEGVRGAKSGSERTIQMSSDIAERLREHLAGSLVSLDGWLFVSPRGHQLRYTNWRSRTWDKIVELADVGPVTPHDLRHSVVTRLFREEGWTVPAVAAYVGHSDHRVTLQTYTHISAEELPAPSEMHFELDHR